MGTIDFGAVADALGKLLETSWPGSETAELLSVVGAADSADSFRAALDALFAEVRRGRPGVHLWVKDERSNFISVSDNLLAASGVSAGVLYSGINDTDPRVAWSRQGPLYVRDDAEVFDTNRPKLEIIERQDREDGETLWLKTSKVPYRNRDVSGGTVGGFEIISSKEAWRIRSRQATAK